MGSENRQNMLGHIGLLGALRRRPADGERRARPRPAWATRSTG